MGKQKFGAGDWFAVPLPHGGWAVGVLAGGRGSQRFGYFFGPARAEIPSLEELADLRPEDAVLAEVFHHAGLKNGSWPVLGRAPGWDPQQWPVPLLARRSEFGTWKVTLDPVSLKSVSEVPVSPEEAAGLWSEGSGGSGAVEQYLGAALAERPHRLGDWFAVPLAGGGWCVGRAARASRAGFTVVYFFGPERAEIPALEELRGLQPEDAACITRVMDTALCEGSWPVIGQEAGWDPQEWPMPVFAYVPEGHSTGYWRRFQEDDPSELYEAGELSAEEAEGLPSYLVLTPEALPQALGEMLADRGGARREVPPAEAQVFDTGLPDDDQILATLAAHGGLGKLRDWDHYLYVPTKAAAQVAARELEAAGWQVDPPRRGEGGGAWLVLAKQQGIQIDPDAVVAARELFQGLAARWPGGDYDGWDCTV